MKHVGIYAGTFDPVHMGHVSFGLAAKEALHLDTVMYLPESNPRFKSNVTSLNHRLTILKLTLADYPGLESMTVASPQFTIDKTLPELEKHFPNAVFTFLIGSDIVPTLHAWPKIEKLIQSSTLAIGIRSGAEQPKLEDHLHQLEAATSIAITRQYITAPHKDARSSDIRAGLRPIYNAEAANYILQKKLYTQKIAP